MQELELKPEEWEIIFKRIRTNPILFIELFWNVAYPDKKIELTEEEKQEIFDKYRGAPLLNEKTYQKYEDWVAKMRAAGYKDWEFM